MCIRDSYYVVKVLKLKPLVVSFDHGFYRPNLINNREKVLKQLGVDSLIFTPNWKLVQKLMLQSFLEKGDFCWHCHTGIFSYPMWVAIEKGIPLIFWGEPSSEYTSYYDYSVSKAVFFICLLYTSPSPRDRQKSRMPSSA